MTRWLTVTLWLLAGCSSPGAPVVETSPTLAEQAPAPATKEPSAPPPEILLAQNRARASHCADPLIWSESLASTAQSWANKLASGGCRLAHSSSSQYGENLYYGAPSSPDSGTSAAESWYSEVQSYDFGSPGFSMRTGHFTQVVWRGTRELGCALARCGGGDLWVCNYAPPGNVRGQYPENVRPTSCR